MADYLNRGRLFLLATIIGISRSQAQSPREFDAVSIKPYLPKGPISEACNPHSDPIMLGRTGCTLEQLIEEAYNLKSYQVHVKGPAWIEADRYVLQARTTTPASEPEMMRMLQPVLADRFRLGVHWEDREGPAFILQLASHGSKLQAAVKTNQCGAVNVRPGTIKSDCLSLDDIAEVLRDFIIKDRPVLNQTGMNKDGRYQVNLDYSPDDDPAGGPSIFSALPDQLGLTLKAGKAPLHTLIVDRAQRPETNH